MLPQGAKVKKTIPDFWKCPKSIICSYYYKRKNDGKHTFDCFTQGQSEESWRPKLWIWNEGSVSDPTLQEPMYPSAGATAHGCCRKGNSSSPKSTSCAYDHVIWLKDSPDSGDVPFHSLIRVYNWFKSSLLPG